MNIQFLKGEHIPSSSLPFSPAVEAGGFVFVSGQASVDKNGKIINESFEHECRRSFENVRSILSAAGLNFSDVVQVRNYVASQEDLKRFNEIYKEYFNEPYPARTTLIGCLGNLLKFEVDVVAFRKG
ncbi:MAG TPA: RidA family protein [Flavisolibacter sp.]|jgi:2-iminobutanoate/2-iminopropanoate deaminase|nr:RidA family protein [Flavisolibacter sp.]